MLSCLIFNSSVNRGIPSLAAAPFGPATFPHKSRFDELLSKRLKVLMWIETKEGLLEIDAPN
jgi:hypothetical protein